MSIFAVILIGFFVIGAVAIVALITVGIVHAVGDKRTRDERLADEHGDIAPGTFKLTPGFGGGDIGSSASARPRSPLSTKPGSGLSAVGSDR